MIGVGNVVPVAKAVPPVADANQLNVPALAVAERLTDPESQREFGVVAVTEGVEFTVAMTAVLADVHVPIAAST